MIGLLAAAVVVSCASCAPVPLAAPHCPRNRICITVNDGDQDGDDRTYIVRKGQHVIDLRKYDEGGDDLGYIDFIFGDAR